MSKKRAQVWVVLMAAAGCGGGGDGVELKHDKPGFRARVPADLKIGADKPDPAGGASLSVANADMSQEVFFSWSPTGSPTDPVPQFDRHKQHEDLTRVVSEGPLAGGGRYIHIERGSRVYVHSVVTSDGFGIECTVSWPTAQPASAALADACKTLQPGGGGAAASAGGGGALGARPSMPAPLAKLRFGMPLEEVKASWPEALEYEFHPPGWDGVQRVNLMFGDDRTLARVFVELPRGTGKAMATAAWGPGTDGGMTDIGPKTTWAGADGIGAELTEQTSVDLIVIGRPAQ